MGPRLLVLPLLAAAVLAGPSPARAADPGCARSADIAASQVTTWGPDAAGLTHVDGLVTNHGPAADSVMVRFSLLSAAGAVEQSGVADVAFAVLGPGESIGFDGVSTGPVAAGSHGRVDGVDALPATLLANHAFVPTTTTQTHQQSGMPGQLAGTVRNDSASSVLDVKVTAILQAADGSVAFVTSAAADTTLNGGLAPGSSTAFSFLLDPLAPAWTTARILAEGDGPLAAQPTCAASGASIAPASAPPASVAVASQSLTAVTPLAPATLPSAAPSLVATTPTPARTTSLGDAVAAPRSRTLHTAGFGWLIYAGGGLAVLVAGFLFFAGLRLRATRH